MNTFQHGGQLLTKAMHPSVIDELSNDLYVLLPPNEVAQRVTGLLPHLTRVH
ncbi:hypothetical protein BAAM0483_09180 [Bifidobacterium animalis subsp. animalis MCC 0483]|uniref:Uncharacterized protein n=1 Tax=Bifidobacterium animalis subsp. animalis MCC 0483 TaxID=1365955 RepID=A0AB34T607_9BIFI|nr:hypothetical protein [Bifidobacterium animalis]KOA47835.1 hypothetical protein BAAM0483_09180 [Bifidobacterium animalis subsp. animalis MCC 0483]